jgi:hypothetical protein
MHKNTIVRWFIILSTCLVFSLTACDGSSVAASSTSTGPVTLASMANDTNVLTVFPLLQQSLQATAQVKSVHVDLQGSASLQTSGPLFPAFAQATTFHIHVSANLDRINQASSAHSTIKLVAAGQSTQVLRDAARLVGGVLYVQAPSGQWFSLSLGSVLAFLSAHATSLQQLHPQALLALAQQVHITGAGMTTIHGSQVRHIVLSIDQAAWGQLLNMATLPQRDLKVAASIKLLHSLQADLFIDNATSRLVRIELRGAVQINVDTLLAAVNRQNMTSPGAGTRQLTVAFDLHLVLSKFNQPVARITAPPGAMPVDQFVQQFAQFMGQ